MNEEKYEILSQEFKTIKSTPNKTKAIKEKEKAIKRQLERAHKRKDFNGENHSRNHKGN